MKSEAQINTKIRELEGRINASGEEAPFSDGYLASLKWVLE